MSEALTEQPAPPALTPHERVTHWEPALTQHGWTVSITATHTRARLDAFHPGGAAVMVTAGIAGRAGSSRVNLYALNPPSVGRQSWLGVKASVLEEFVRSPKTVSGRHIPSKCHCRSSAGRRKTRYATERLAKAALLDTVISRELHHQARRAECRAYQCPTDDRVWHLSSRPVWRETPGESPLWPGEVPCA